MDSISEDEIEAIASQVLGTTQTKRRKRGPHPNMTNGTTRGRPEMELGV